MHANYVYSHTGLYLSLKEIEYTNNSIISINEIRESETALKCIIDKDSCCGSNKLGEWYYPNGLPVPMGIDGGSNDFFRNRDNYGSVNLNRVSNNVIDPTGEFCCSVPDASNVTINLCATIGKLYILIRYLQFYTYLYIHYYMLYSKCQCRDYLNW